MPESEDYLCLSLRSRNTQESVKNLRQVVELLQKTFEIDNLVDTIEDKGVYEELSKLNVG
jgi:hypothetical protein